MPGKLLIPVLFFSCFISLYGQNEQLVIKPPEGSQERVFSFENPRGSIRVTGYEGDHIVVTGTFRFPEDIQKTNGGFGMRAEVNGRNVLLLCRDIGKTVDFDIKIPSGFSLKLKSLDNGNVDVFNISGEIEISNSNGSISLGNISGAAVLSSVYGNITASFREVKPGSLMIFTSFEGSINLTVPETLNSNVRMKTDKGDVVSDFAIQPLKRQPATLPGGNDAVSSSEGWVTGSINKGGAELLLRSYSGNITLKKR
jgi:hypothetical protein